MKQRVQGFTLLFRILVTLLLPATLWGQEVTVKRERVFTGSGLYGFMNGGAEQFLEYGVSKLTARDVVYEDQEYTIEIYEMPSPEDAFGIYSLHVFKCERADTAGCVNCLSPYQLQAVSGSYYASVVFPSGSAVAKCKSDDLIRLYVPMDGKDHPEIPLQFRDISPRSGKLKFLRGPVGLSGVSLSLSHYLDGIPYTGVWFVADKATKSYRALIQINGSEERDKLKEKIPATDIIESGKNFLYITGKEKESQKEEYGGFGF